MRSRLLLLDTNALIWVQQNNSKLGKDARRKLERADALYFSPISVLEIEIKRMRRDIPVAQNFYSNLIDDGFTEIRLSGSHSEAVRNFPTLVMHDPFDRVLLATAAAENLKFVTADSKILQLDLPFLIDAQA